MLAQNVQWLFLVFLLFVIYVIAFEQMLADIIIQPPPPIASTNVSTVSAGSAFTMKCKMPDNYTIGNKTFYINFNFFNVRPTAYLIIPALTSGRNQRLFYTDFNNNDKPYIASIQPVSSTITVTSNTFEVNIITTMKTFSAKFYCDDYYNSFRSVYSNKVTITTTTTLSLPTLISNVSHVPLHHPFTLTCSLPSQFNPKSSAYQVAFLSSRDGLIADYEIEASGRVTLVSKEHVNSSAHLGTRAAFPTFDLEILEHVDRKLSYWCEQITVDLVMQKKSALNQFTGNQWNRLSILPQALPDLNAEEGVQLMS